MGIVICRDGNADLTCFGSEQFAEAGVEAALAELKSRREAAESAASAEEVPA